MRVRLDPASRKPLSEQLAEAIARRIVGGSLAPGSRVPTVRRLAEDLDLAANTVAKAYRELEAAGLLVGRGRLGTFVVERLPGTVPERERRLAEAATVFARRADQLGSTVAEARGAIERAFGERRSTRGRATRPSRRTPR